MDYFISMETISEAKRNIFLFASLENLNLNMLMFLMDYFKNPTDAIDKSDQYAILGVRTMLASSCVVGELHERLNIIKCLVERKCDVNERSEGQSPIELALKTNAIPEIRQFLRANGAK